MSEKQPVQDLDLLNQAFGRFNEAVDVLSGYYDSLSREIASLNLELEEKNRALSESLAENERSKQFLAPDPGQPVHRRGGDRPGK